jgi:2-polyprenyl-3-methyl-5-hydroxy-6-metoxy-1,4-benzoquinol methylase
VNFDDYAGEVSARFGNSARFDANRKKMWSKAYAPLMEEIRCAKRILEHGCGGGEFLEFLGDKTTADLVGYDISRSQLALAQTRLESRKNVSLRNLEELAREDSFDLVFSLHVIEHIPDDQLPGFVRELCRSLKPGGKLVIATPNGLNPFSYAYYMSADRTHVRMHSPMTLAQLLMHEGFSIDSVHRELPQIYDLMTFLKTIVWWGSSIFVKLAVLSNAAGVRQHRLPLLFAPTFYVVASRSKTDDAVP